MNLCRKTISLKFRATYSFNLGQINNNNVTRNIKTKGFWCKFHTLSYETPRTCKNILDKASFERSNN